MNEILETIYNELVMQETTETPFYTQKIEETKHAFFDTYFSTSVMTSQEYDTASTKFLNFANAVEENAFEVGFYTAVKLLTEDNGVLAKL